LTFVGVTWNMQRQDNSTFEYKIRLRACALIELKTAPVIMETHGGFGAIFARCYRDYQEGVVFDHDADRVDFLAKQRPTWAVYQADSITALRLGVGSHLTVNFLDCDPYGEVWPTLKAFFYPNQRPRAGRMAVVINDGLGQFTRIGKAWESHSLAAMVKQYGNAAIDKRYLEISKELFQEIITPLSYRITRWTAYRCGHKKEMTHWAAIIERKEHGQ